VERRSAAATCCLITIVSVNPPMQNHADPLCRACGLELAEPPWRNDGASPTFAICPCCGVEFGYGDCQPESVVARRKKWLSGGAQVVRSEEAAGRPVSQLQRIGVGPQYSASRKMVSTVKDAPDRIASSSSIRANAIDNSE
jgi:hypothetical protein